MKRSEINQIIEDTIFYFKSMKFYLPEFAYYSVDDWKKVAGRHIDMNIQKGLVDKDNVIVAGHTRRRAAEELGIKEVPVLMIEDLTDEQIKAFRIMDNKSNEFAEWDNDLLREEFKILKDTGFDLELTGFSEEDVESELKLDAVENINLFDERHRVITLNPPEAPRLKEIKAFHCKNLSDYNKIKDYFEDSGKLNVDLLLNLIR